MDPQYADGQAGMSENQDTNYYGGLKAGAPYGANTRGLGVSASVGFGPVTIKGYAESEGDYNKSAGSVNDALGVAVTLGKFRGFSLTGFYNAAYNSGNDYFAFANPVDALGSYYYTIENQKYSSSFGVKVAHDGQAEDALSPPSTSPPSTPPTTSPATRTSRSTPTWPSPSSWPS